MIVAYDVSHVQTRRSGIGRFSFSLLREILRLDSSRRYVLHGWSSSIDRPALKDLEGESARARIARVPGAIKRAYWDHARFIPIEMFIGRFDVFHSADPFNPPVGHAKTIVTVYDLISTFHPQFFERKVVARDSRRASSLRRAHAVIVPSLFTFHQLVRSGLVEETKIRLVRPPLPMDFTPFAQPADSQILARCGIDRPYLLFVGTIEPRKNVRGLLRSFERVCDEGGAEVDLVIAGKIGWLSKDIPKIVAASPYVRRIHLLSYVPEETLPVLYRHATCFVYPSFVEGYGLPVAEAMASGVPVITSDSSALAEIGAGGAVLIDPQSDMDLLSAIKRVLFSDAVRHELRDGSLRRAGVLRAERGAETVLRLYAELEA